jgi:hypothetical protein
MYRLIGSGFVPLPPGKFEGSNLANQSGQQDRTTATVNRRTMIVWTALVGAMTVSSGLLMWLEPRPLAPAGGLALAALDSAPAGIDSIFHTRTPLVEGRWNSIVVHHSGQQMGSAESISELHQALGYHGLGFHFVIGNGDGADDGLIQVGYRWMDQIDGEYVPQAISICIVGNGDKVPPTAAQMDQLVRLVTALQARTGISGDQVNLHSDLAQTTSPGRFFPEERLQSRLIDLVRN